MKYYIQLGEREFGLEVLHNEEGTIVRRLEDDPDDTNNQAIVDFAPVYANLDTGEGLYSLIANGKSYQLYVEPVETGFRMLVRRHRYDIAVLTEREWRLQKVAPRQSTQSGELTIKSPMPGLVKGVLVAEGDTVTSGQRLLVLEAMKMENDITSPRDGKIKSVHVQAGAIVEGGKPLVSIES
ncbi:MAG: biotin/lipoyl-containing protein [Chloroflexia bacterium]